MDDWFRAAPVRQRRIAVGAHRYNAARGILGHEPEWHELIRPSGELLTVPELEQESAYGRMERLQNVRTIVANNRANVEQLRRYGARHLTRRPSITRPSMCRSATRCPSVSVRTLSR